MVRIDRVVTRGGDGGETSLGDGTRVSKADPRIEAIGAVDEANASVGVLRVHTRQPAAEDAMLARIQNDLFDVGADLCVPGTGGDRLRVTAAAVAAWKQRSGQMNAALPPLTQFHSARRHRGGRIRPCGARRRAPRGADGRRGS